MTDRELLELAAKAAGKDLTGFKYFEETAQFYWEGEPGSEGAYAFQVWSPLTDDGDALRLAVKLGLSVQVLSQYSETQTFYRIGYVLEKHKNDPYAATRRAIVRAAAEIGKGMP